MPAPGEWLDAPVFTPFADRCAAGRQLAAKLSAYAAREDVIVLGLPRGGVPVAYEVALALEAPLDVMLVRKLGVPRQPELAFGAIASGGVLVLNPDVLAQARIGPARIDEITAEQLRELERREQLYRAGLPALALRGRTAVIVDDGLATGATMRAAVRAVRQLGAAPVVAVPVAPRQTCGALRRDTDEVVCLIMPEPFRAVGLWYRDFTPTSDEHVRELLASADRRATP
jgi:putative phosphoribosyl transferase